jgi:hypothetical protein
MRICTPLKACGTNLGLAINHPREAMIDFLSHPERNPEFFEAADLTDK